VVSGVIALGYGGFVYTTPHRTHSCLQYNRTTPTEYFASGVMMYDLYLLYHTCSNYIQVHTMKANFLESETRIDPPPPPPPFTS